MTSKARLWIATAVLVFMFPGVRAADLIPLRGWATPPYWQSTASVAGRRDHTRSALGEALPASSSPLPFVAMTPCRIVDTRFDAGPFSGPALVAGTPRSFDLAHGPCTGIAAAAAAYSLNVTVTASPFASPGSYLTVWATGEPTPNVSTLNYATGQTIANAAIVPAGADGAISVLSNASTHVIIDINGYYAPPPSAVAAGAGINPLQVALLRWYGANQPGSSFAVQPYAYAITFDGAHLWVTNSTSSNLTKLRASDGAVAGTYAAGTGSLGVAFDGANIWVSSFGENKVVKVRASDGANQGAFTVGSGPGSLAFDGSSVWIANYSSGDVTRIRASDGASLGTYSVGPNPTGIAFDGSSIWVATYGDAGLTKLRASDGANQGKVTVGAAPYGVAFDGASVWVASSGSGTVSKVRASDGAIVGTFVVGPEPNGVVFDGSSVWVARGTGKVVKLRPSDGAVIGTFSVDAGAASVAFDGAHVWVVLQGGSVVKL